MINRERLTDRRTAEQVRENIEKLRAAGFEVSVSDVRYVKLAEYEEKEKRGKWIWDSNAPYREHGAYKCSICGCHSDFEENYCYNCGARMDLKEE